MFNPLFYKAFNPDLARYSNNKLLVHWKTIGKNENRISNIEDFFILYPNFDYDNYKHKYFEDSNPDKLQVLAHKHLNNPNESDNYQEEYNLEFDNSNIKEVNIPNNNILIQNNDDSSKTIQDNKNVISIEMMNYIEYFKCLSKILVFVFNLIFGVKG